MPYDFDSIIDRRGRDAMAVDVPASGRGGYYLAHIQVDPGFDCIPMWIADMNFATAPCIPKAMAERVAHPLYGYFQETDAYYDAILNWQRDRHGVTGLTRDCIGYENGVLGGHCLGPAGGLRPRRAGAGAFPHLCGLHPHPGRQRLGGGAQPPQKGRKRRLADGLCRHGAEAQDPAHPRRGVLLPPQPGRPGVGAPGAGTDDGAVCPL